MQQLLITAQKIRREADKLEEEGQRIFVEMEGLGYYVHIENHRLLNPIHNRLHHTILHQARKRDPLPPH